MTEPSRVLCQGGVAMCWARWRELLFVEARPAGSCSCLCRVDTVFEVCGGEGMELAAVTHANEKVASPVEFHGVGRQMMAFARAAVLNVGTPAARVMVAMCCGSLAGDGSPREENPLLSELSVDVRASGDVKRREMPRERSRWSFRVDCRQVLFRNHGVRRLHHGA